MPPGQAPSVSAAPLDVARSSGGKIWTCFKSVVPTTFAGRGSYASLGSLPTLMLRKTGGSRETRPLVLDLSQDGAVAGGLIYCVIKSDVVDRNQSPVQGTPWLIRNTSSEIPAATQPEFTVLENPSATNESSAGSDPRTIFDDSIFQTVSGLGTGFVFDFRNRVMLKGAGSLLIYVFSTVLPAPTLRGTLLVAEE